MTDTFDPDDIDDAADPNWRASLLASNPHLGEFLPFLDHLNQESARGAVLISCSFLDELLRRTLAAFMAEAKAGEKLIDGFNAPLGTFSSRITCAFALGLITKDEHDTVQRLRSVRNAFAHSVTATFDDPKIKGQCDHFQFMTPGAPDLVIDAQQRFTMAAVNIITRLINRPHYAGQRRLSSQAWPN